METSRALTCVCLLASVQRASKGNSRVGHAHEGSNKGHEGEGVEVGELQHSHSRLRSVVNGVEKWLLHQRCKPCAQQWSHDNHKSRQHRMH